MPVTNTELNKKLDDLLVTVASTHDAVTRLDTKMAVVDEHHKTLYGNGQPGLKVDVDRMKTRFAWTWTMIASVGVLLGIMQGLTGCQASGQLATQIAESNTRISVQSTYEAMTPDYTATPYPTLTATDIVPHNTDTPEPTITLTPWRPVEVTPCGTAICEFPDTDENILSRLCTVEVRGFGSKRRAACLSVISTVFKRMEMGEYSDGSVTGTILWGCTPEHGCNHFPGFVVNGCEGIVAEACPWNYPADIAYFQAVARDALNGDWEAGSAVCRGYTYYGSRDSDMRADACIIESETGQREAFYN